MTPPLPKRPATNIPRPATARSRGKGREGKMMENKLLSEALEAARARKFHKDAIAAAPEWKKEDARAAMHKAGTELKDALNKLRESGFDINSIDWYP